MKKVLWLIVCLMTMVLSVNAQDDMYMVRNNTKNKSVSASVPTNVANDFRIGEWFRETTDADELKSTKGNTYITYIGDDGFVTYLISEGKLFFNTDKGLFDYDIYDHSKGFLIGFYDINDNLVEKVKTDLRSFLVFGSRKDKICITNKGLNEKIWGYINNHKGFVRFVIDRYERSDFDIKVPCINN